MLRFDSGKSLIENVRAYDWAIAGCGAVPAMQATMSDQVEVIAIANDESSANMILTRPDSPILAEKGFNPDFPNVFGTPESVKGKLILCPKKTSARYLLDKWLAALGLEEKDVKIEELEPTPALGAFKNGYGDILAVWSPFHPRGRNARVQKLRRIRRIAVQRSPCSLSRIARSRKRIRTPCVRF